MYECQGIGPDGKPYRGIVEITKNDDTYRLQWTLGEEGGVYLGLGIIKDNTLAVSYFGEVVGVVLYRIETGSRLVGEWTVIGADGHVYSETLTRVAANQVPLPPARKAPRGIRTRQISLSAGLL
jgi:hypothetical protein